MKARDWTFVAAAMLLYFPAGMFTGLVVYTLAHAFGGQRFAEGAFVAVTVMLWCYTLRRLYWYILARRMGMSQ